MTFLLVLIPIFTGHYTAGHFKSLILDRTDRDDGIFVFFDSYPGGSLAAEIEEFVKGAFSPLENQQQVCDSQLTCRSARERSTMFHFRG
jgi:hypothetical protein